MTDAKEFGAYLKALREKRNLTTHQVEAYAGVSNSYLSLVENGKRGVPSAKILKKLAPIYKVTPQDLLIAAGYWQPDQTTEETVPFNDEIDPESMELARRISKLSEKEKKALQIILDMAEQKVGKTNEEAATASGS